MSDRIDKIVNKNKVANNKRKHNQVTTFIRYICIIHEHDKSICDIYECNGTSKINNYSELSKDLSYCK